MNEDNEAIEELLAYWRNSRSERNKGRQEMKSKIHTVNSGEVEIVSRDRYSNVRNETVLNSLVHANFRARMATALMEKWGLVAGVPDGEDTTGRSKLRLLSPKEIVERAVETADMAVSTFERLGWLDRLPSISEMEEEENKEGK